MDGSTEIAGQTQDICAPCPTLHLLDPFCITDHGALMRLEDNADADATLRYAIAEHGQQVPVLVRAHPTEPGRYQIVAGRRRVLALRDLGRPVQAIVLDVDDAGLHVARGQENTVRSAPSYIEKAAFAHKMLEAGFTRALICDALSVNKTLISRMVSVFDAIPAEVIAAIGPAPGKGRERWAALARLYADRDPETEIVLGFVSVSAAGSDQRFDALERMLARGPGLVAAARAIPLPLRGAEGITLGHVSHRKGRVVLSFGAKSSAGFETWLLDNLEGLHLDWLHRDGG